MSPALLASLLLAPATLGVDCSRGGDLARVLRSLQDTPPQPVVLEIAGTCSGPVEVVRDGVTLRGVDSGGAAIVGGIAVRGAHQVRLQNLRLFEGRVGLAALGAEVTVEGCDLARTDIAVDAEDATVTLTQTTLREARNGIRARRSRAALSFGTIRDVSDEGVLATELSQVTLFRAQVSSDGLAIESSASLSALHCTLEGDIHVGAYSRISLAGASGPTAVLRGDVVASHGEVFLFRLPIQGTVRVRDASLLTAVEADLDEVRLDGDSHARFTSARVAGDLLAEDFSTARLTSTSVGGILACRSGADAVCEQAVAGSVSACPSCAP